MHGVGTFNAHFPGHLMFRLLSVNCSNISLGPRKRKLSKRLMSNLCNNQDQNYFQCTDFRKVPRKKNAKIGVTLFGAEIASCAK